MSRLNNRLDDRSQQLEQLESPSRIPSGIDGEFDPAQLQQIADESAKYLGDWHDLVSRTNWEKGRIICRWRERVSQAHPEVQALSDRAWSHLAGGISPEHVGRLRRTYARFGEIHENYPGLRWSHFMAALAWDDAEMWLEGAVQNSWTIDTMRRTRWEALGAVESEKPAAGQVVADEDPGDGQHSIQIGDGDVIAGPVIDGPDWGDPQPGRDDDSSQHDSIAALLETAPQDWVQAFRSFQAAIQDCEQNGWKTIKRRDAIKLLNCLKDQVRNGSQPPF